MIYGKVWGTTRLLFKNQSFEIHRLDILAGGYCSVHKHLYKHNIFFVERGALKVYTWQIDYELCDTIILNSQGITSIGPNLFHKFEALEDTIAFEIYHNEPITKDIIRDTIGGLKKNE